jgi:hypothetical protein
LQRLHRSKCIHESCQRIPTTTVTSGESAATYKLKLAKLIHLQSGREAKGWRILRDIYDTNGSLDEELARLKISADAQAIETQKLREEVRRKKAILKYKKAVAAYIDSTGAEIIPKKVLSAKASVAALRNCVSGIARSDFNKSQGGHASSRAQTTVNRPGEIFHSRSPGGTEHYDDHGYLYYYFREDGVEKSAWSFSDMVPQYLGVNMADGEADNGEDTEAERGL